MQTLNYRIFKYLNKNRFLLKTFCNAIDTQLSTLIRFVEKDLESMWQAANSENKRVKEILLCGSRKLCDHIHLTDALKDEIEKEELLHFSDDDSA